MILPAMAVLPGCCDCAQHDGQEDMLTAPDPSPLKGGGRIFISPPAGSEPVEATSRSIQDEKAYQFYSLPLQGIAIGKYEVTFADYDRFMNAADYAVFVARFVAEARRTRPANDDEGWGRGTRPVINVNWNEAKAYAAWLSAQTGKPYRLPSEAEWEYAARAGTTTAYSFGNSITCSQASYGRLSGDSCNTGRNAGLARTVEAGSYAANAFGLHDMHGNVWEWVEDCYVNTYIGAPSDGSARTSGCGTTTRAVVRGGSWYTIAQHLRSAVRNRVMPTDRGITLGFRLVQDLNP